MEKCCCIDMIGIGGQKKTKQKKGELLLLLLALVILSFDIVNSSVVVTATTTTTTASSSFRRRRIIHYGDMKSIRSTSLVSSSSTNNHHHYRPTVIIDDDNDSTNRNKMWPPWPFNLIGRRRRRSSSTTYDDDDDTVYPTTGALVRAVVSQRTRFVVRQIQHLSRELWFHLPPATPPLVVLAAIPLKFQERRIPTLLSNHPFARNLVLSSLGLAVVSWANAELYRKRLLTPLPLYQDMTRAILPLFLPEEVVDDLPTGTIEESSSSSIDNGERNDTNEQFSQKMKRNINQLYHPSTGSAIKQWRMKRASQRIQKERRKREEIYDELVALQQRAHPKKATTKHRATQNDKGQQNTPLDKELLLLQKTTTKNQLGYALVTGASRGIGRALAIELARWEIPLILVARDRQKLIKLADEIEECYGVTCCVLQADLSEYDAAKRIYDTTTKAGLKVDVLVNNAGVSASGDFVDMDETSLQRILQINAVSPAALCHLYGKDMKTQRRGRILLVSSVLGAVPASPTVAAYAATKAFEKMLGLSIAKELELYGVGVTCLIPGAVGGSSFRKRSGSGEALCWKIPFYAKSCKDVASQGVRALLEGDPKVIPGWQNRAFVKMLMPILPERAMTIITEATMNPIRYWWDPKFGRSHRRKVIEDASLLSLSLSTTTTTRPPKILKIYTPVKEISIISNSTTSSLNSTVLLQEAENHSNTTTTTTTTATTKNSSTQ